MKLRTLENIIDHLTEKNTKENDSIQNLEFYNQPHFNDSYQKVLSKRRNKRKLKHKKTLLFWGDGDFKVSYTGHTSSPCHLIKNFIIRKNLDYLKIKMVNESYTSKTCLQCKKTIISEEISYLGFRLKKCTFCLNDSKPCYFERDIASAKFIYNRGNSFLS